MIERSAEPSAGTYYERREQQERAVAERAASEVARQIHLALADRYAELARD